MKAAIHRHESIMTEKIKKDKNRARNLWKNIDELHGKTKEKQKDILFDSQGNVVDENEICH